MLDFFAAIGILLGILLVAMGIGMALGILVFRD